MFAEAALLAEQLLSLMFPRNREDNAHRALSSLKTILLLLRMLLAVNTPAIFVLGFIQPILLGFGQVTVVLGLIDAFPFRDIGIMSFIAGGFLTRHRAIRQALIDPRLLIVQPLIDFVDARMIGNVLRHRQRRTKARAAQNCNLQVLESDDISS